MSDKVTTVRLTEEQMVEIELVCRVLGISVSELIRHAIRDYLTERKADAGFQQRLRERIEKDRTILLRLTGPLGGIPDECPDGRQHSWMDGRCRHCGTPLATQGDTDERKSDG